MISLKPLWRVVVFLCPASVAFAAPQNQVSASETPLPADPGQFVRETIKHEVEAADHDHTHWRYHLHREDEKVNYDRDVIDTKDGQLARTLLINGQPLTPEQRGKDEERMKKLVNDAGERAKREKRAKEDEDQALQMFKAIPDAFIFKYDGAENGQIRLAFFPNPHYDPPTLELKVFRSLSGKMWIDRAAGRLARIDGALFEDVTFGWGILGRLNKGGTFAVVQKDVGDNHWDIVALDVTMYGRAVFFKTINKRQKERLTDFRRVRDDLSIAQAYEILDRVKTPYPPPVGRPALNHRAKTKAGVFIPKTAGLLRHGR